MTTISRLQFPIAVAVVCLLACLPVWIVEYPPLMDWPNHLARIYIIANYREEPAFQHEFVINSFWRPNVGLDWLGVLLFSFLPAGLVTKTILSLTLILFVLGSYALARTLFNAPTAGVLLSAYFVYNTMFLYGFMNYCFGVGLFLVAFAYWLAYRPLTTWRAVIIGLLSLACWFVHLTSYGFLLTAAVIASVLQNTESLKVRLLRIVPPLAGGIVPSFLYLLDLGQERSIGGLRWEGLTSKMLGVGYLFATYDFLVDGLFLGALLVLCLFAYRWGGYVRSRLLLTLVVLLALVYFVMPTAGFAGVWAMDRRTVLPALALLLLPLGRLSQGRERLLLLMTCLLVSARTVWIGTNWLPLSVQVKDYLSTIQAGVMRAGYVYPVTMLETLDKQQWIRQMCFRHAHCYLVPKLHLIPANLFAYADQHSLRWRRPEIVAAYGEVEPPFPLPEQAIDVQTVANHWEYVVGYRLTPAYLDYLSRHFELVVHRGDTRVFATPRASIRR